MEPSTIHTHTPLTRTVHITRTCLTHIHCTPTESGTVVLMSILSWALSQEVAHPPLHPRQQGPNTPRSCSLTPPSPPRAARGAKAVPKATVPRFPQRHRMVRCRNFWSDRSLRVDTWPEPNGTGWDFSRADGLGWVWTEIRKWYFGLVQSW